MRPLSPQALREALRGLGQAYPRRQALLLEALHLAQAQWGWLGPQALEAVAQALGLPRAEVKGVATFYDLFEFKPPGRHMVQLCSSLSCMLQGAGALQEALRERLRLSPGHSSPDGRLSLKLTECLGACDRAPVMMLDGELYGPLAEEEMMRLLEACR
jgi:NADH-quinone oxidoreductase E subunit